MILGNAADEEVLEVWQADIGGWLSMRFADRGMLFLTAHEQMRLLGLPCRIRQEREVVAEGDSLLAFLIVMFEM